MPNVSVRKATRFSNTAITVEKLANAGEGLSFYLVPDFGKVKNVGLGKVITSAMSQAFFTLGLGIASMEIFGSYMNKDRPSYLRKHSEASQK